MSGTGPGAGPTLSLLSVGTVWVAGILLGFLLGRYLDGQLGTGPWLAVGGFLLGAAAGFLQLFRAASRHLMK